MTSKSYEAGIQPYRLEFVRESTRGEAPTDPAWNLYSDNVRTNEPSIDAGVEAQEGLGSPDYTGAFAGNEEAELTVTYDLQQWLVDGSSNPQDASYDGVSRDSDNRLENSHTVVRRLDEAGIATANAIGSSSRDTRLYVVGKGGLVDEVTYTANIDSGQPIQVEVTYSFEKLRYYQIDQPDSGVSLHVESTNANDTTQTLTVEDEGAGTSEDISLNGTTTAAGTESFGDIDALSLDAETQGDVKVYVDDGTGSKDDQIAVLYGQESYDQGEGDLGVPSLGSGSHASSIGGAYELPLDGDAFELPSGTQISDNITSHELSVSNNVDARANHDGPRPVLTEGGRDAEVSVTVFGQAETYQHTVDMLQTNSQDYKWTASDPDGDSGSITLNGTEITDVGESEEARQDTIEVDVTIGNQQGVQIA